MELKKILGLRCLVKQAHDIIRKKHHICAHLFIFCLILFIICLHSNISIVDKAAVLKV